MGRIKASPGTTLLPLITWLGGPALSVAAGSSPPNCVHSQAVEPLPGQSVLHRGSSLPMHPEGAGCACPLQILFGSCSRYVDCNTVLAANFTRQHVHHFVYALHGIALRQLQCMLHSNSPCHLAILAEWKCLLVHCLVPLHCCSIHSHICTLTVKHTASRFPAQKPKG